jgi:outer membrane protein OmpA-like peptidoglycan-associated protein
MNSNLLTYFIFSLFSLTLLAQEEQRIVSDKVSDCDGATIISRQGSYELEFTGNGGIYNDVQAYPSLNNIPETNSLWAQFTAPFQGSLSLSAFCPNESVQMVIFSTISNDGCGDIFDGKAEIQRFIKFDSADTIGLRKETGNGFLYSLNLKGDESIYFYFNARSSNRNRLKLNIKYDAESIENAALSLTKTIDFHQNMSLNTLTIILQDGETGLPVLGQVYLNDGKKFNAMYRGTNFILDINRNAKLDISVDAEGYFFYDRTEVLKTDTEHEVIIWLEPLKAGKKMEIPGIEFVMGSSEFSPGTEVVLKRLRNFLLLNSTINIEIQGHVHAVGENSMAGKRLSHARAKRVMLYLIESGVDKKRLQAVGYGNEFMKYPEPKFSYEEQANRRVEIKIL